MNRALKYSGIVTVLVLWSSILLGIHRAHLNFFGRDPLSHLGIVEASKYYFSAGLIVAVVSVSLFYFYLKKRFLVGRYFTIVFFVGQLGQVIVALAPYGGKYKSLHTFAAFILAFSIPVFMGIFASNQRYTRLRKLAFELLYIEIAAFIVGIGSFVFIGNTLAFSQALPAVAFHLWLITMTFQPAST